MIHLLRALLLLFPPAFRRRFGAEMAEQVEEDVRRARRQGWWRALRVGAANVLDLAGAALAERAERSWDRDESNHGRGVGTMMMGWAQDLGHAVRSLARVPGFAAAAVLTLGLAMGVNAGLFSVVEAVLLRPLPYDDVDRLVFIAGTAPGSDLPPEFGVGPAFYQQYRDGAELEQVAVWDDFTNTVRWREHTERLTIVASSNSLLPLLGTGPLLGRLPRPDDRGDVVVLSHGLWTSWFGRDPDVVGRTVWASGADRTVIGVMGPDFWFPYEGVDLWLPVPIRAQDLDPGRLGSGMVARTGPGVEPDALAEDLAPLAARIPERFGGSPAFARIMERYRPVVRPLEAELLGDVSGPLWVLLASVAIVLLIACANVANLFLVRVAHRGRDMAVRAALGAGRGRRLRILLAEALAVAVASGVVAVTLAWAGVPLLVRLAPDGIPRLADAAVTPGTLLFTGGLAVFVALACGLVPAVRGSAGDLGRLRDGARGSTGRSGPGRSLLVAGQTALALVLLIGSGLLLRSFAALNRVDPGYDTADLFSFQIAPERDQLDDGPSYLRFYEAFHERLGALPGVESVGMVENLPLDEGMNTERFVPVGSGTAAADAPLMSYTFADADYFGTMGVAIVDGRAFTPDEERGSEPTIMVSESAARLLWPDGDPVGRGLRAADGETTYTVVGMVEDVLQHDLRQDPDPTLYLPPVGPTPDAWSLGSPAHVVRSTRAGALAPEVRALVREVAPEAPMYRVYTMEELAEGSMASLSFTLLTLGIVSALALLLGAVGLFGVLSYTVARRTREIGVRMALGADAGRVRGMVVGQGVRVVLAGVAGGLVVAFLATRVLDGLLYGVEAADAATFAAMAAAMTAVGLLASWLPAWRASRVEPVESLREG